MKSTEIASERGDDAGKKVKGAAASLAAERPSGWLNRYRRLAKDDEQLPERSEAMIHIAMLRLRLAPLARKPHIHQLRQQQPCQTGKAEYALAA